MASLDVDTASDDELDADALREGSVDADAGAEGSAVAEELCDSVWRLVGETRALSDATPVADAVAGLDALDNGDAHADAV